MTFNIGDRVRLKKGKKAGHKGLSGLSGVVRCFWDENNQQAGVEFDVDIDGHGLNSSAIHPHRGWFCKVVDLELEPVSFEMAWHCYRDQLGRTYSQREQAAFQAGFEASRNPQEICHVPSDTQADDAR